MHPVKTWASLCFLLAFTAVSAQNESAKKPCKDVVKLTNGKQYRGEIASFSPGDSLVLMLGSGEKLVVNYAVIKQITRNCGKTHSDTMLQKKWYKTVAGGVMAGQDWNGNSVNGLNLQLAYGYQKNRWLGLGIGAGVENYISNFLSYSVKAEYRGYLKNTAPTPFWALQMGYGFTNGAWKDDNFGWWGTRTKQTGGLHSQIAVGWYFNPHFYVQTGLILQNATKVVYFDDTNNHSDKIQFRRINFAIGFNF